MPSENESPVFKLIYTRITSQWTGQRLFDTPLSGPSETNMLSFWLWAFSVNDKKVFDV